MAEENPESTEKTEEPSEERRELFRDRGEIAHSRELTSVLVLVSCIICLTYFTFPGFLNLQKILKSQLEKGAALTLTQKSTISYVNEIWFIFLKTIIPIFIFTSVTAIFSTLAQTKFNFSMQRLKPSLEKLSFLGGLKRMISFASLLEVFKGVGKMFAVGTVAYLILHSEWRNVPGLMNLTIAASFFYWAKMLKSLLWSVSCLLVLIAGLDYIYNYFSLENRMKMTKQELKDEYKQREVDPMIRGKMRKLQREIVSRKTIKATKEATVIITNPTHFAIALKYEIGMSAPILTAKGIDFVALRMREIAKENAVPIVENKPLARKLYADTDIGSEIPEDLYKAVSEVIRYVFKQKGVKLTKKNN